MHHNPYRAAPSLPSPLVGVLLPWWKLAGLLHPRAPLLAYYSALYLAESLVAIITDYVDHGLNPHALTALHAAELQATAVCVIQLLEDEKACFVRDPALLVSFSSDALSRVDDVVASQDVQRLQQQLGDMSVDDVGEGSGKTERDFKENIALLERMAAPEGDQAPSAYGKPETESAFQDAAKDVTASDAQGGWSEKGGADSKSVDMGSLSPSSALVASETASLTAFASATFSAEQVLNSEILSKNYLINEAIRLANQSVEAVENNSATKSTGNDLIRAAQLLEIAVKLYPAETASSKSPATPSKSNNGELSLTNIESLYGDSSEYAEKAFLTNKDIVKKIKYSKLTGVRVIKLIKANKDNYRGVDFVGNHELMLGLAKLTQSVSITDDEIEQTIKAALQCPSDTEDTETATGGEQHSRNNSATLFPEIPRDNKQQLRGHEHEEQKHEDTTTSDAKNSSNRKRPASPGISSYAELIARQSQESVAGAGPQEQELHLSIEQILSSSNLLLEARKCCKYALSAIEYEDDQTAVKELEESIRLIRQHQEAKNQNS